MDSPVSSTSRYSITPDDSVSNIGSNSTHTSIYSKPQMSRKRQESYSTISSSSDKCSAVSSRLEDLKHYVDKLHSKVKKQADHSRSRLNESYKSLRETDIYNISSTSSDSDSDDRSSIASNFGKTKNDSIITNNTAHLMNGIDQYIKKCKQSMPEVVQHHSEVNSSSDESSKISSSIFATNQRAITGALSDITDNTDHLLDYIQHHKNSETKKKSEISSKSSSTSSSFQKSSRSQPTKRRSRPSSSRNAASLSNQRPIMDLYEEVQKGLNHPAIAHSQSSQPKKTPRSRSSRVDRKRRRIQRQEEDLVDAKENQQPRLSKELLSKIKQWDGWQSFKTQSSIILDLEEQQQKNKPQRRSARRARSGKRTSKNSSVLYSNRSKTSTRPRSAKRVQSARVRANASKKRSNSRPASASINHRSIVSKAVQKKREMTSARSQPAKPATSTIASENYTQSTTNIEPKRKLHVDILQEDDTSSTSSFQPTMKHRVWAEPVVDSSSSSSQVSSSPSQQEELIYKPTQSLKKERIIPSPKKKHPTFDYVSSPMIQPSQHHQQETIQKESQQLSSRPTTASTRLSTSHPTSVASSSGDYYVDQSPAPLPSLGRPTPRVPRRSHTLAESMSATSTQASSTHNVSVQSAGSSVACQTGEEDKEDDTHSTSTMSDHSITLNISRDASSNIVLQIPARRQGDKEFAIKIQGNSSSPHHQAIPVQNIRSTHIAVDPLLMDPNDTFSNPISLEPLKNLLQRMNSDDEDSSLSSLSIKS